MKLIDADVLRKEWLENGENEYVYNTNSFLESIDEQPEIDIESLPVVQELRKQIEQLKTEKLGLEIFYKDITSKPDCNTCIKQNNCKYCPGIGEISRFNCPLWEGDKHDT